MKFSLEPQQRDFFRKNNALELESLLSTQQLALLQEGIIETTSELFPSSQKPKVKEHFSKSRDLWRLNDKVKRIATNRNLVELSYELISEKPIRLGFDQLLPALESSKDASEYPLLYNKENFRKTSAIQDLLCILLICISGDGKEPCFEEGDPFPSKPGNGVYLSPDYQIDYQHLFSRKNQTFYLIAYAGKYSQYLFVEEDPQGHALKKLGYVFGDTLNDSLHPILLR